MAIHYGWQSQCRSCASVFPPSHASTCCCALVMSSGQCRSHFGVVLLPINRICAAQNRCCCFTSLNLRGLAPSSPARIPVQPLPIHPLDDGWCRLHCCSHLAPSNSRVYVNSCSSRVSQRYHPHATTLAPSTSTSPLFSTATHEDG